MTTLELRLLFLAGQCLLAVLALGGAAVLEALLRARASSRGARETGAAEGSGEAIRPPCAA